MPGSRDTALLENRLLLEDIVQAISLGYDMFDGQWVIEAAEQGEALDLTKTAANRISLWQSCYKV